MGLICSTLNNLPQDVCANFQGPMWVPQRACTSIGDDSPSSPQKLFPWQPSPTWTLPSWPQSTSSGADQLECGPSLGGYRGRKASPPHQRPHRHLLPPPSTPGPVDASPHSFSQWKAALDSAVRIRRLRQNHGGDRCCLREQGGLEWQKFSDKDR